MQCFLVLRCKCSIAQPIITPNRIQSGMVYGDAERLYKQVHKIGQTLLEDALDVLFPDSFELTRTTPPRRLAKASKLFAYNTTFFPRWDVIEIPVAGASSSLKGQVRSLYPPVIFDLI